MRRSVQDESVAWFKLADLIRKKEKEKALNVYRLLSHSYENRAYVLQVEADILWALDDRQAFEVYKQAALLYKRDGALIDAIAVLKHVLYCCPEDDAAHLELLLLYATVGDRELFEQGLQALVERVKQQKASEMILEKTFRVLRGNVVVDQQNSGGADWVQVVLDGVRALLPEYMQKRLT